MTVRGNAGAAAASEAGAVVAAGAGAGSAPTCTGVNASVSAGTDHKAIDQVTVDRLTNEREHCKATPVVVCRSIRPDLGLTRLPTAKLPPIQAADPMRLPTRQDGGKAAAKKLFSSRDKVAVQGGKNKTNDGESAISAPSSRETSETRMPANVFRGSLTALITPFRDGKLDEDALRRLVEWQIAEGTHGLVPTGTTGESPTLDYDEHNTVIEVVIEQSRGRVPVMAGTGSNSTAEAIYLSKHAEKAGAQGLLVVTPYYNKPTQEGLYQHFKAINDAVGIPIFIYNIPPRSIVEMSVETMARLYELKNIVGVKDATANLARVSQQRAAMGPEFVQLSGEDATALAFNAHGGVGCISVASNVAPRLCADFQNALLSGDFKSALTLQDRLMPLHDTMFIETNPGPVKYAASLLGLCSAEMRLPMVPVTDGAREKIRAAMQRVGLIKAVAAE
jgi:4-hydroxy-tetrahydrodipicolinate synthase